MLDDVPAPTERAIRGVASAIRVEGANCAGVFAWRDESGCYPASFGCGMRAVVMRPSRLHREADLRAGETPAPQSQSRDRQSALPRSYALRGNADPDARRRTVSRRRASCPEFPRGAWERDHSSAFHAHLGLRAPPRAEPCRKGKSGGICGWIIRTILLDPPFFKGGRFRNPPHCLSGSSRRGACWAGAVRAVIARGSRPGLK